MKFRKIFLFEFYYQLRHVSTWLYCIIPILFPVVLSMGQPTDEVYFNAPSLLILATIVSGIFWLLTGGAIAGNAAARDIQTLQHPLMYTMPISKSEYLGGRFMAAFTLNVLIQLAIPISFLLSLYIVGVPSGRLAPFRLDAYLTTFFYFALPNTFFVTVCQFSAAVLERRAISSYIGSVLIFPIISHFMAMSLAKSLGDWDIWRLIDLSGISIINSIDTWTVMEKNTRLLALKDVLLWNRLLWLGVTLSLLTYTYFRFQFTHPVEKNSLLRFFRRRKKPNLSPATQRDSRITASPPETADIDRDPHRDQVIPAFSFTTYVSQARAIAWSSFRAVVQSKLGMGIALLYALHMVVFASQYLLFQGVAQYPKTMSLLTLITPSLSDKTPLVIILMLIAYFAGELVWRERDANLNKISDTVPVHEWVFLLGKFGGLCLSIVAWLLLLMTVCMLHQALMMGYTDLEITVYLKALFGFQLADYLLFALLALVVHVIVDQKYLGHLVIMVIYLYILFHSRLGIGHNLLIYGADSGWSYTDMRGFEPYLWPWLWFKLYWAGWAMLLAVAARLLWVRSVAQEFRMRLRLARNRFTRGTATTAALGAGIVLVSGGYIFYNTNVLNHYTSASDRRERHARYELNYSQYRNIAQPRLTGTKLHVELYPSQRRADIRGTYNLVNRGNGAIDSIHLATVWDVETGAVTFDRPTSLVLEDPYLGHRIYRLNEPLKPGDSLSLSFDVHLQSQGFSNHGIDASVIANGTYLINHAWAPAIGYQPERELRDADERKQHGLVPKKLFPSLYDTTIRETLADRAHIDFEAVVGTEAGQIAIATGNLLRHWSEDRSEESGERNYFHYATSAPIKNIYSIYSANYAVREVTWRDSLLSDSAMSKANSSPVAVRIYYHPGHAENIDRVARSIRASLSYYTQKFGPYPYSHLTVVERSGYEGQLNAEPTIIDYGESFTLPDLKRNPRGLDIVYFAIAHEVAHQWWGAAQLTPAAVEGAPVLAETLANYSALKVLEQIYGSEQVRLLLAMWRNAYEVPRSRATVPLLEALDPFLAYRKGPLALYALMQYTGKERVNDALRQLILKHGSGQASLPTTLDLYRELKVVTPDSVHYLLRDYFEKNIYWQLKTTQAAARQIDSAAWEVTLNIDARKVVVDSTGAEISVPMNDWIEIGVYPPWEEGAGPGKPFYLEKHRIRAGEQTITITVPAKPGRAGIDPNYLLIDLDLDNNTRSVEIEGIKNGPDLI